jgi:large subunit ribosomal protein L1
MSKGLKELNVSKRGKRYIKAREGIDPMTQYSVSDAVEKVLAGATVKFEESVDVAVRLGVNPRKADQMVRGACSLPHGTGKTVRVAVFADGEAAKAAKEAGADFVGGDELVKKIQEGWTDFDKAVAVRTMMAKVGRIGRILGPRGLMPNPKTGTVVAPEKVADVVRAVKGGRVDFRVEKAGIIQCPVGKSNMSAEQLRENVVALMATIVRLKPASAKGTYVRSITISSTMGPGVRIDSGEIIRLSGALR